MKGRCRECIFFEQEVVGDYDGICRRHAPSPYVETKAVRDVRMFRDDIVFFEWPSVTVDDWCGEFRPNSPATIS
jgi:hypothetical protein